MKEESWLTASCLKRTLILVTKRMGGDMHQEARRGMGERDAEVKVL